MTDGYDRNEHLPSDLRRNLPADAQDVYRIAYNSAVASGKKSVDASKAAWAAVELGWQKGAKGAWVKREVA